MAAHKRKQTEPSTVPRGKWAVGLDIGGTFTDVMMVDSRSGKAIRYKSLTTPSDPAVGALSALESALHEAGAQPADVAVLLHATTLVSNALIERKGAITALVATRGFKDVLDIGREKKFDIYDLLLDKPTPLVSSAYRFELDERMAADGSIVEPLTEESIVAVSDALRSSGAEAVAVCLIHSYMNPQHERRLRDRLLIELPDITVCISNDILPEMREFERTSTAVANAYVQPLMSGYLERFREGLKQRGMRCPFFVMLSEGAIAAPEIARRIPIRVCESGPAAGAVTAAAVAEQLREPRVLSFDMGGTTAKACIVHDGMPTVTTEFEVARMHRFKKGSGLPLRIPVVELIEIGAGGGSLTHVDELGLLKVGPESAAADPGPACYGRGGSRATVTDADLVLGYLGADSFLGGRMRLDESGARRALGTDVGLRLHMTPEQAAMGVYEVVNENMANASRVQALERGYDPSAHVLVAFGGAGPAHAWGVASKLGISKIVVPPSPGVGSAFGLLLAPRAFQLARTYIGTLESLDWLRVQQGFEDMAQEATRALLQADVKKGAIRFARRADMRYRGQRKEITVDVPTGRFDASRIASLREVFEKLYERVYHRRHKGHPVEVLCWRLTASGPAMTRLPTTSAVRARRIAKPRTTRPMLFAGWSKRRLCGVYSRYDLAPGTAVRGPAAIEEDECTTVVGPGGQAQVDGFGNLVLRLPTIRGSV